MTNFFRKMFTVLSFTLVISVGATQAMEQQPAEGGELRFDHDQHYGGLVRTVLLHGGTMMKEAVEGFYDTTSDTITCGLGMVRNYDSSLAHLPALFLPYASVLSKRGLDKKSKAFRYTKDAVKLMAALEVMASDTHWVAKIAASYVLVGSGLKTVIRCVKERPGQAEGTRNAAIARLTWFPTWFRGDAV